MSFMRGDLVTRTRKLVKGLAIATPKWLKRLEQVPHVTFPPRRKIEAIELPEDVYVRKFFKKHPDSLYHDAIENILLRTRDRLFLALFDPPPARVFAWRVLELKDQGVTEAEAMAVADTEYAWEKKAKKKAYKELKKISSLLGKKPPPNPYPSAIKEIQVEKVPYIRDSFKPRIRNMVRQLLGVGHYQQGGGRYPAHFQYPADKQQGSGQYPARLQYPGDNQQGGGRYPARFHYPADNQQGGSRYHARFQLPADNQHGGDCYPACFQYPADKQQGGGRYPAQFQFPADCQQGGGWYPVGL